MKKLLSVAIPAIIIGFVLFTVGGKLVRGFITPEDPVRAAKLNEVGPVLKRLRDEHLGRFEHYRTQQFKGVPTVSLYDYSQLNIEYTVELPYNAEQQRNDAEEQFHRLICRDTEFKDLYKIQTRLLEQHDRKLDIAINISGFDPETKKLLWHTAVTPQSCIKRAD
jgi:hypothetical protein